MTKDVLMKPLLSMMCAWLAVMALSAVAHAELLYGHTYSLQNAQGGSWNGGYLDTRVEGCDGANNFCVATASTTTRDGGSGTWLITSANGKANGTPVMVADTIVLQNMYDGNGGYLYDLFGTTCSGGQCVFTTTPGMGAADPAAQWQIQATDTMTQRTLSVGDAIYLRNQNFTQPGTYLTTTPTTGCNGDLSCVNVTDPNGYLNGLPIPFWGSTWRFVETQAPAPAQVTPGWCLTTDQPGTIVTSDATSLYWDVYGNLTLTNFGGYSSVTGGHSTSTTWGVGSAVPLHASSAATLCYASNGGALVIADSSGHQVWSSTNAIATSKNNSLSLAGCTLSIYGGSPSIMTKWTETTPECHKRMLLNSATNNTCWPTSNQMVELLYDNDDGLALRWYGGMLYLTSAALSKEIWTANNGDLGGSGKLCLQSDGNLVIYNGGKTANWAANSVHGWPVTLALDTSSVLFQSGNVQYVREDFSVASSSTGGTFTQFGCQMGCPQTKSLPGWCRTTGAAGPILVSPDFGHLDWTSGGSFTLYDPSGNTLWSTNTQGALGCFQLDGNLVIYDGNNRALWAASWSNMGAYSPLDVLTFDGVNATVINQSLQAQCSAGLAPVCDANGQNCAAPTGNVPAACSSASYYTVWSSAKLPPITYFTSGGGFSFVEDLNKGNSDFGAELWIVGAANSYYSLTALEGSLPGGTNAQSQTLADLPTSTPPTDYAEVLGDTGVSVTLFGDNQIVFSANGFGSYDADGSGNAQSQLTVGSLVGTLYSGTAANISTGKSASAEIFSAQMVLDVGGIPVTLKAGATGSIGFTVSGACSASNTNFSLGETPFATLDADVSVEVGEGISVSIEADLTLVSLSLPITASANWQNKTFSESIDFNVSTLSGEVDLVLEAGPLKATKTLTSFNGYSTSETLFSLSNAQF
jgi:hypothetical protein